MSGVGVTTPDHNALLSRAAAEVLASADQVREDAGSPAEIGSVIGEIVVAVAALANGDPVPAVSTGRLGRRLVERMRRAYVAAVAAHGGAIDGAGLLRMVTAFETLGEQLEPAWDERFADRLSGSDGLELVVEIAHDLRSPLTSILFLAETLQRGRSGDVSPLQQRQLGLIYSAAFGLSSVTSDVIDLARGGDRLVDLEPLPFSLADIFESVSDIVQPIAEEKGLEVRLRPPEQNTRIGQPVALSRVLLNLTTNALKFTDKGFVEIQGANVGGDRFELSVRDTGRGIPADSMTMLFEPFRRRQRRDDYAFSGSGLGLLICRKLVEAMEGELKVETGPAGTRFYFVIDLPPAADGPLSGA